MRISDWSSDVCSSDLIERLGGRRACDGQGRAGGQRSAQRNRHHKRKEFHRLVPESAATMVETAGPHRTMNSAGIMNTIITTAIFAVLRPIDSRARATRLSAKSAAKDRKSTRLNSSP